MKQPVIMHINFCEQGQSISEVCRKAADWGFDGVEFRGKRANGQQSNGSYLDEIAEGVSRSKLKHVLFGAPVADLMNPDPDYRKREVEEAIEFYRLAAKRFHLTVCNATTGPLSNPCEGVSYGEYDKHGSYVARPEHYFWAVEGFQMLGDVAQELGFRFAFELHPNYLHDTPQSTKKLLDCIGHPAVGANLDFDNVLHLPSQPSLEETLKLLSPRIYYVHLKNSLNIGIRNRMPTALSDGEINHRQYLRLLREIGYDGPLCIEAPRPGDREWYAPQDIAYLRSLMEEG